VATRFNVMTQAISSWVADRLPLTCGSTTLAKVIVIPNSRVEICTVNRISHCRALMLNRLVAGRAEARGVGADLCTCGEGCRASATDNDWYRFERPGYPALHR